MPKSRSFLEVQEDSNAHSPLLSIELSAAPLSDSIQGEPRPDINTTSVALLGDYVQEADTPYQSKRRGKRQANNMFASLESYPPLSTNRQMPKPVPKCKAKPQFPIKAKPKVTSSSDSSKELSPAPLIESISESVQADIPVELSPAPLIESISESVQADIPAELSSAPQEDYDPAFGLPPLTPSLHTIVPTNNSISPEVSVPLPVPLNSDDRPIPRLPMTSSDLNPQTDEMEILGSIDKLFGTAEVEEPSFIEPKPRAGETKSDYLSRVQAAKDLMLQNRQKSKVLLSSPYTVVRTGRPRNPEVLRTMNGHASSASPEIVEDIPTDAQRSALTLGNLESFTLEQLLEDHLGLIATLVPEDINRIMGKLSHYPYSARSALIDTYQEELARYGLFTAFQNVHQSLPDATEEPSATSAFTSMFESVLSGIISSLKSILGSIADMATNMLSFICDATTTMLRSIAKKAVDFLTTSLVESMRDTLRESIRTWLWGVCGSVVAFIVYYYLDLPAMATGILTTGWAISLAIDYYEHQAEPISDAGFLGGLLLMGHGVSQLCPEKNFSTRQMLAICSLTGAALGGASKLKAGTAETLALFPCAFTEMLSHMLVAEDQFAKWRKRADKLCDRYRSRRLAFIYGPQAHSDWMEAKNLLSEHSTFIKGRSAADNHLVSTLSTIVTTLSARITQVSTHPPFCLALFGIAGVGKTTIVKIVADYLMKLGYIMPMAQNENNIYNVPLKQSYFSGYAGQPFMLFDDIGFNLTPDLFTQYIVQLKSPGLTFIEQASLNDPICGQKGDICVSKMIITTSNTAHQDHVVVTNFADINAYRRRRDALVKVVADPKVMKNGAVNAHLVKQYYPNDDFGHLSFSYHDRMASGEVRISEPMGFREFLTSIADKYCQYERDSASVDQACNDYIAQAEDDDHIFDPVAQDWVKPSDYTVPFTTSTTDSSTSSTSDHCFCTSPGSYCSHHLSCRECLARVANSVLAADTSFLGIMMRATLAVGAILVTAWAFTKVISKINASDDGPCYILELEEDDQGYLPEAKRKNKIRTQGASGGFDGDKKTSKKQVHHKESHKEHVYGSYEATAGPTSDQLSAVKKMITEAEIVNITKGKALNVNIVWPCGTHILFPAHYLAKVEAVESDHLELKGKTPANVSFQQPFSFRNVKRYANGTGSSRILLDICRLQLSCSVSSMTDRRGMLVLERDLLKHRPNVILMTKKNGTYNIQQVHAVQYFESFGRSDGDTTPDFAAPGFVYKAVTQPGDCGGLLYDTHENIILGMHVGRYAKAGRGKAVHIDRDWIPSDIVRQELLEPDHEGYTPESTYIKLDARGGFPVPDNVVHLGRVSSDMKYTSPIVSKLHPTIFFDENDEFPWGKCQKAPAILSSKDPRARGLSPMYEGLKGLGNPHQLPPDIIDTVEEWLIRDFIRLRAESQVEIRVYTLKEAINGVAGVMDKLILTTSDGWFWARMRPPGAVDRAWLFSTAPTGEVYISHKPLLDRLAERERLARLGVIIQDSLYVKLLKDEKLKHAKISEIGTRIYDAGPIDLLLMFRRYFGAFQGYFETIAPYYMHAIGVDCTSVTWDYIMQQMRDLYPSVFDGDVKNWDKKILSCLQRAIINAINRFYRQYDPNWGEEDDMIRRTLFEENINTWSLVFAEVILLNTGVPSGNFMTASGNSILNRAIVMAWALMLSEGLSYSDFIKFIKVVVMGDDHLVRVQKEVQDVLNGNSLRDWFFKHGVVYTPADKTNGNDFCFLTIDKVEFVKMNNRVLVDGKIVAVPMKISIDSGLQYLMAPPDTQKILLNNLCEGFTFQLFWHGEAEYNKYRSKLLEIGEEHDVQLVIATYQEKYLYFLKEFGSLPGYEPIEYKTVVEYFPSVKGESIILNCDYETQSNFLKLERLCRHLEKVLLDGEYVVEADKIKDLMADLSEATEGLGLTGDIAQTGLSKQVQTPVREAAVQDPNWSYSNLVEKRFFLRTVPYTTANVPGDILTAMSVPLGMVENCQQRIPFERFKYWKGNAGLRLVINKNPFQSGMLVVWWAPMVEPGLVSSGSMIPGTNLTRATGMRHVLIDIQSTSTAIEFEVPFTYLLGALPLDGNTNRVSESCMGTIGISVMAPLRAGSGTSTTLSVNLHSYFPESSFMVPLIKDDCVTSEVQSFANFTPSSVPGHFVTEGGHVSKNTEITNVIIGDSNATSQDPGGDVYEQGTRLQASYQVGGADFDRCLTNIHPIPIELNTHASQNKVVQPIAADPLGPTLKEQPICREHVFGTKVDEMSFHTLLSTWQYFDTISWSTADLVGAQLYTKPISVCPLFSSRAPGKVEDVKATYMDYLSSMHAYWHGPIEIKIVMVASGMVSGSLVVAARYGELDTTTYSLSANTTQYYSVLALDNSSRSMEIEFANPTNYPYFKTSAKRYDEMTLEEKKENFPGTYTIAIQNPLIVGSGAPSVVDILLFIRAPKLKFFQRKRASAVPNTLPINPTAFRGAGMSLESVKRRDLKREAKRRRAAYQLLELSKVEPMELGETYEHQSGAAYPVDISESSKTDGGRVAAGRVTLGQPFGEGNFNNLQSFSSLRTHIKQFYGYLETAVPSGAFRVEDMFYISYLGAFASIYSMWRGVSLLKAVTSNPDDVVRITFTPNDVAVANNFDVFGDCCYKGIVFAGAPARVFAIPFVTQYKFLLTPEAGFNTSDPDFNTPGTFYFDSELGETVYPFYSLGDEFRFGGLIGVPVMNMDPEDL
jgi:hypothetical protein